MAKREDELPTWLAVGRVGYSQPMTGETTSQDGEQRLLRATSGRVERIGEALERELLAQRSIPRS